MADPNFEGRSIAVGDPWEGRLARKRGVVVHSSGAAPPDRAKLDVLLVSCTSYSVFISEENDGVEL